MTEEVCFLALHTLGAPYQSPPDLPYPLWDTANLDVPRRGLWALKGFHRARKVLRLEEREVEKMG